MEELQSKHEAIVNIVHLIIITFGEDFFNLPGFWEADNYAVGLKRGNKLIYISNWDYKDRSPQDMWYSAEFERIDGQTAETLSIERVIDGVDGKTLIKEIKEFLENN